MMMDPIQESRHKNWLDAHKPLSIVDCFVNVAVFQLNTRTHLELADGMYALRRAENLGVKRTQSN